VNDTVTLRVAEAYDLSLKILQSNGFSDAHAAAIARSICRCERDECRSHGLYRLLVCVHTLRSGKVSAGALPEVTQPSTGIVRVDAKGAYSLLAFDVGRPILVDKARMHGIAAMAITHCYHFSAIWPEVEDIAEDGIAALCMLPSHSFVAPAGGTKPVFGTNPFAFAWPRPDSDPYVFDFATSAVARGEIELHRRAGKEIPLGWALDSSGRSTTDPAAALAGSMLTFGGHKGSALSTMIELLAGPMIGDLLSLQSLEYDAGAGASPYHGELVVAFDPKLFALGDAAQHARRAEGLFEAIAAQGARLPSQRRYEARARSAESGVVRIPRRLYEDILALRH
jgi:delta1-piperideine-2-carboxylate reductase